MMELLSVRELAGKLKVSTRHVWALLSSGRLPKPVRVGRAVRWRADDVTRWVEMGCPARDAFEATGTEGTRR